MGLGNVWLKQRVYCKAGGETSCPAMLFREELAQEIKKWKQKYETTILIMDTNK